MNRQRPNPPEREQRPGSGALLFSIISLIVSLCFIFYGVSVLPGGEVSPWLAVFGYVTIAYGLLSFAILACSYQYRSLWCITTSQVSAAGYLIVYVFAVSAGLETGLGFSGILVVALALWCNWFAINAVVRNQKNVSGSKRRD